MNTQVALGGFWIWSTFWLLSLFPTDTINRSLKHTEKRTKHIIITRLSCFVHMKYFNSMTSFIVWNYSYAIWFQESRQFVVQGFKPSASLLEYYQYYIPDKFSFCCIIQRKEYFTAFFKITQKSIYCEIQHVVFDGLWKMFLGFL